MHGLSIIKKMNNSKCKNEKLFKVTFIRRVALMEKVVKAKTDKDAEIKASEHLYKSDADYDDVEIDEVEEEDDGTYREEI